MKLSICCITYNHGKFIKQALESFLMQDFEDFEIIVSDDNSTDNTREILKEYQSKNPYKIKLILNNINIGMMPNFIQALKSCKGEYIALCEGDDYWTDKLKLRKQFEFMEKNKEYVLCFHDALVINETNEKIWQFSDRYKLDSNKVYTIKDAISNWFIPTGSILYRNIVKSFPTWFTTVKSGDLALTILLAQKGNLKYINEEMSVYRIHSGGISTTVSYNGYPKFESSFRLFQNFKHQLDEESASLIKAKQYLMFKEFFDRAENLDKYDVLKTIELLKSLSPIRAKILKFLYYIDVNLFRKISWRIL